MDSGISKKELIRKAKLFLESKEIDKDIIYDLTHHLLKLCEKSRMDAKTALDYMKEFNAKVTFLALSEKENPPYVILENGVIVKYGYTVTNGYIRKQEWTETEFLDLINDFVLL